MTPDTADLTSAPVCGAATWRIKWYEWSENHVCLFWKLYDDSCNRFP